VFEKFDISKVRYLVLFIAAALLSCCTIEKSGIDKPDPANLEPQDGQESMLSKELEVTLNNMYKDAHEKRYAYATVEQLLLALLDNPSAAQLLRLSGAEFDSLRTDLNEFITKNTPLLETADSSETGSTEELLRVLHRTVLHVQTAGKKEALGSNVLIAIFGERDSHAVKLLNEQSITRLGVLNNLKEQT